MAASLMDTVHLYDQSCDYSTGMAGFCARHHWNSHSMHKLLDCNVHACVVRTRTKSLLYLLLCCMHGTSLMLFISIDMHIISLIRISNVCIMDIQ